SELKVLEMHHALGEHSPLEGIKAVLSKEQLIACQEIVRKVEVDIGILEYITRIIRTSREFHGIFLGASPRSGVALLNASKAYAILNGRDFVTPDDVKAMALPVLRHRILLSPEKEMEGANADELIQQVISKVEVPR